MALQPLNLTSLAALDGGRIREAFDQAIERCRADCADRPGIGAVRKVTLLVTMKPLMDESGELDSCDVDFQVQDSAPKRRTRAYNMRATRHGGLQFNELSPDDASQRTLDEVEPMSPAAAPKLKAVGDAR